MSQHPIFVRGPKLAETDLRNATEEILLHAENADEAELPGIVAVLEIVLDGDERPAADLVDEIRREGRVLTDSNIRAAGEVVIPELDGYVVMILADGDTFTGLDGCKIVRLTAEQHDECESGAEPHNVNGPLEVVARFGVA